MRSGPDGAGNLPPACPPTALQPIAGPYAAVRYRARDARQKESEGGEHTETHDGHGRGYDHPVNREEIVWMSTQEAARRLGVTPRTLYRFVDEGTLAAYKMGRVFRLKQADVDAFIEGARVAPGSLEHLYPERKGVDLPAPSDPPSPR